jgi:CO dehydrogenase/acetyl-CoA synthase alpha subunit
VARNERQNREAQDFIRAGDSWEPVGHTPLPGMLELRNWDRRLLQTWKPLYVPVTDKCSLCTYGECNLSGVGRGACGIDAPAMQARLTLRTCCAGLAGILAGARRVIDYLVEVKGREMPLDLGDKISIEAPHFRTVLGLKPAVLCDLERILCYVEDQLALLLAAGNTGYEASVLDLESKAMHASMLTHVVMEAKDLAASAGFAFPSSKADTALVDVGWAAVDTQKPVILVAGSDTVLAACLVDYLRHSGLEGKIEVAGIGPVAHDLVRYCSTAKIAGTLSMLPFFLRSGIADVVMCGGGNMLTDIVAQTLATGAAFIATDPGAAYGLEDLSVRNTEEILIELRREKAILLPDPTKAAAVAVETALKLSPSRGKVVPQEGAARREAGRMRVGRGPVMDTEIRKVGAPLVLGTIPGVIAIVGGSNYPGSPDDMADIAEEFARRKYIVVLAGDSAIAAALKTDAEGKSIYERYPPEFDAGGVINIGSGVSAAHISGAAIKIASIFAALPLRANYEVVADYILNRVGACGLAWGACGEEELALATGFNRLGIPVIVGPNCIKYGRLYVSKPGDTDWSVMDGREKRIVDTGEPSPEHLINLLADKGSVMVAMAKLCMRRNDTPQGRATKLTHYVGLHKQYFGKLPVDVHLFVRKASDIPIFFKKELQAHLNEAGWREKPVLSLPTLVGTYRSQVTLDEVVH